MKNHRCPRSVPGQLQKAAPDLRTPDDRGGLGQIQADVIVPIHFRLAEILDLARGLEARAACCGLQRSQLDVVPAQGEVGFRGPGKGTISAESGVRLAQQKISFVDGVEQ